MVTQFGALIYVSDLFTMIFWKVQVLRVQKIYTCTHSRCIYSWNKSEISFLFIFWYVRNWKSGCHGNAIWLTKLLHWHVHQTFLKSTHSGLSENIWGHLSPWMVPTTCLSHGLKPKHYIYMLCFHNSGSEAILQIFSMDLVPSPADAGVL